jgi:hypothetical protein
MPEFDAYLMVDWSASSRTAKGPDSIWYCLATRTDGRVTVAALENPVTPPPIAAMLSAARPHRAGGARTTEPGYENRNSQTTIRSTGLVGTDHGQYIYVLRCGSCSHEYGANGSDIHIRRCPLCQGGRPGLPY